MIQSNRSIWFARLLIFIVFLLNIQCAIFFLYQPELYAPGFELEGIPGIMIVRGIGILFLMWNIPYTFAWLHPVRFRVSLVEAIFMQTIGVVGETVLLITLPAGHPQIQTTALRFILFDSFGLIALIIAFLITRQKTTPVQTTPD